MKRSAGGVCSVKRRFDRKGNWDYTGVCVVCVVCGGREDKCNCGVGVVEEEVRFPKDLPDGAGAGGH